MAVSTSEVRLSFSIIDPEMTVKAMRDSGYKSTTHALAELIDNSIESHATAIGNCSPDLGSRMTNS